MHLPNIPPIKSRELKNQGQRMSIEPLWTRAFLYISIINLLTSCVGNMLMTTFPFYILDLGGDIIMVGLVSGLYAFFALLMRPIAGWYLDNISRKSIFILSIAVLAVLPLIYIFVPILAAVMVMRCFHGFVWSAASTASNTNAFDIIPRSRFGEGIGYFGLTNSVATAIAPAIGLVIMQQLGFDILFGSAAFLSLLTLFFLTRIRFATVTRRISNFRNIPFKSRVEELFNKDAIPAATFTFLASVPGGAISAFVALYAEAEGLGNGGLFFTFQAIFAGLSRLISGRVADVKGEGPLVYGSVCCFAGGLVFLVFCQNPLMFYLAASLIGLGYGLSIPAMQAMSVRIVPAERRGSASSTFLCSWDVAWVLGGILGGLLVDGFGYRWMFAVLALFEVAATMYYYFFGSKAPSAFRIAQANHKQLQTEA